MPDDILGANEFTVEELEQLFSDDTQQDPPTATETTASAQSTEIDTPASNVTNNVDTTKAFAKRLKESTDKARREERENIAKSLGYESYEKMQQERERKLLEDKGFDFNELSPIVDEIVRKRLEEDPRMLELKKLKDQSVIEFGKKELAEITKLTGGEITSLAQLPSEVIDLWKQKGSLQKAYLELEGAKLINKIRSEHSKGSTSHLNTPAGSPGTNSDKRPLTADEKRMYKFFNPGLSDEELNKITTDK